MKQLLILSGKGGTGKTTTAAAFIAFAEAQAFADCDVDAPNLHLVAQFAGEPERRPYLGGQKALVDAAACARCGRCAAHCRFGAVQETTAGFVVDPIACEGCGVCVAVCPEQAVRLVDDVAGEQALYREEAVFSTAKLKMGRGNSGKLVTEVKKALVAESEAALAIIDGSPGIGCPVIASVSGVDMVLLVAEPSVSGLSDLERIVQTCRGFGTKVAVCVNKADVSPESTAAVARFCAEEAIPLLGTIPYDRAVPEAINAGQSIAAVDSSARDALRQIFDECMALLYE